MSSRTVIWLDLPYISSLRWAPDDLDGYLNFYSVSGDGRVINWTLVKCLMRFTEKLYIKLDLKLANIPPYILHEGLTGVAICHYVADSAVLCY